MRRGRHVAAFQQLLQPGLELHLAIELDQRCGIRRGDGEVIQAIFQLAVQLDGGEAIGEIGIFTMRFHLLGQGLGATEAERLDAIEIAVDGVEAAFHALQQAQRGLLTHARHAGDVVDLVAHQREEVDDQVRRNAELLGDAVHIQRLVLHGVDQGDVLVHQLGHVLVAGRDDGVTPGFGRHARQGADDVIGLDTFHAQQWQAKGTHAGMQRLDLQAQVIRHRRTLGLVLGVHVVAEGLALGIEDHCHGAVRVLANQALEHVDHALHRAGGQALGGGQRRQSMKGTIEIGRSIDENDRRGGHEQSHP